MEFWWEISSTEVQLNYLKKCTHVKQYHKHSKQNKFYSTLKANLHDDSKSTASSVEYVQATSSLKKLESPISIALLANILSETTTSDSSLISELSTLLSEDISDTETFYTDVFVILDSESDSSCSSLSQSTSSCASLFSHLERICSLNSYRSKKQASKSKKLSQGCEPIRTLLPDTQIVQSKKETAEIKILQTNAPVLEASEIDNLEMFLEKMITHYWRNCRICTTQSSLQDRQKPQPCSKICRSKLVSKLAPKSHGTKCNPYEAKHKQFRVNYAPLWNSSAPRDGHLVRNQQLEKSSRQKVDPPIHGGKHKLLRFQNKAQIPPQHEEQQQIITRKQEQEGIHSLHVDVPLLPCNQSTALDLNVAKTFMVKTKQIKMLPLPSISLRDNVQQVEIIIKKVETPLLTREQINRLECQHWKPIRMPLPAIQMFLPKKEIYILQTNVPVLEASAIDILESCLKEMITYYWSTCGTSTLQLALRDRQETQLCSKIYNLNQGQMQLAMKDQSKTSEIQVSLPSQSQRWSPSLKEIQPFKPAQTTGYVKKISNQKLNREMELHFSKKALEIKLHFLPLEVIKSCSKANQELQKGKFHKLTTKSNVCRLPRCRDIYYFEHNVLKKIELNIKQKYLLFLKGQMNIYKASLGNMIPKAPLSWLAPTIEIPHTEVDEMTTELIPHQVKDILEWHIKGKLLHCQWGLPLQVQKSLNAFMPSPANTRNSMRIHQYPLVMNMVNKPLFLSEKKLKCFEGHIKKNVVQLKWGIPSIIRDSLESFIISSPVNEEQPVHEDTATFLGPNIDGAKRLKKNASSELQQKIIKKLLEIKMSILPEPIIMSHKTAYPTRHKTHPKWNNRDVSSLRARVMFPLFFKCHVIYRIDINIRHKYLEYLWAHPSPSIKSLEKMMGGIPQFPILFQTGGCTVNFMDINIPFVTSHVKQELNHHIKVKELQLQWGLPLCIQQSRNTFMPPAPMSTKQRPIILSSDVEIAVAVVSPLPFITTEVQHYLEIHTKKRKIQIKWGIPQKVIESICAFMAAAPLEREPLPTRIKISYTSNLPEGENQRFFHTYNFLTKVKAGLTEAPYTATFKCIHSTEMRKLCAHYVKKFLEITMGTIPAMVCKSHTAMFARVKKAPPKRIQHRGTTVLMTRKKVLQCIDICFLKQLDKNVKQKHLAFLWGHSSYYSELFTKSISNSPHFPAKRKQGSIIEFTEMKIQFLKDNERENLEWTIKLKEMHQQWALPALIHYSNKAFIPPAPNVSQVKSHLDSDIHLSPCNEMYFISKETKQCLEIHMKKHIVQQKMGIPRKVVHSLLQFIPALPLKVSELSVTKGIKHTMIKAVMQKNTDLPSVLSIPSILSEKALLLDPQPIILIRVSLKERTVLNLHIRKKCIEVRKEVMPFLVRVSYVQIYWIKKKVLRRQILPGKKNYRSRTKFLTFIEEQVINDFEINMKHKYLAFLWGIPSAYIESLQKIIPKPPPLCFINNQVNSGIAVKHMATLLISKHIRSYLEWHITLKKLQHQLGLSWHIQESHSSFIPTAPFPLQLRISSNCKKEIFSSDKNIFVNKQIKICLERHIARKILQREQEVPKQIVQSLIRFMQLSPIQEKQSCIVSKYFLNYPMTCLTKGCGYEKLCFKTNDISQLSNFRTLDKNDSLHWHFIKRSLEIKMDKIPLRPEISYNIMYPVKKYCLPKFPHKGLKCLPARVTCFIFLANKVIEHLDLNIQHKHLTFLWGLSTPYTESQRAMITYSPTISTSLNGCGAIVEAMNQDSAFMSDHMANNMEWHITKKNLHQYWGLPMHLQKSINSFMPAPLIPLKVKFCSNFQIGIVQVSPSYFNVNGIKQYFEVLMWRKKLQRQRNQSLVRPVNTFTHMITSSAELMCQADEHEQVWFGIQDTSYLNCLSRSLAINRWSNSTTNKYILHIDYPILRNSLSRCETIYIWHFFKTTVAPFLISNDIQYKRKRCMWIESAHQSLTAGEVNQAHIQYRGNSPVEIKETQPAIVYIPFQNVFSVQNKLVTKHGIPRKKCLMLGLVDQLLSTPQMLRPLDPNIQYTYLRVLDCSTICVNALKRILYEQRPLFQNSTVAVRVINMNKLKRLNQIEEMLEWQVQERQMQDYWVFPAYLDKEVDKNMHNRLKLPPVEISITSHLPEADDHLFFVTKKNKELLEKHLKKRIEQKKIPSKVQQSWMDFMPSSPLAPEHYSFIYEDELYTREQGATQKIIWQKENELLNIHFKKKVLETKLGAIPSMVTKSFEQAYLGNTKSLLSWIRDGAKTAKVRKKFLPFVEPLVVRHLHMNIKHKYLVFLCEFPVNSMSMENMIPKAPASLIEIVHVEKSFISETVRDFLEWHLNQKRIRHLWGLPPIEVTKSLIANFPPPPKLAKREVNQHTVKAIAVCTEITFVPIDDRCNLERHIKKLIIQKKMGIPHIVANSLRQFIFNAPIINPASVMEHSKERNPKISLCMEKKEHALHSVKPLLGTRSGYLCMNIESTNVNSTFFSKCKGFEDTNQLFMHATKKALEIKLNVIPVLVNISHKTAQSRNKQYLPIMRHPGETVPKARTTFLPFVLPHILNYLNCNMLQKNLIFIGGLPAFYRETQKPKISSQLLLPPSVKGRGAFIEFTDMETPFIPQSYRTHLDWHIKEKSLQHLWGLSRTIQRSVGAFVSSIPQLITATVKQFTQTQIIISTNNLEFLNKEIRCSLELHTQQRIIQRKRGLPMRTFIPTDPVSDSLIENSKQNSKRNQRFSPRKMNTEELKKLGEHLLKKCLEIKTEARPTPVAISHDEICLARKSILPKAPRVGQGFLRRRAAELVFIEQYALHRIELNIKHKQLMFLLKICNTCDTSPKAIFSQMPPRFPEAKESGALDETIGCDISFMSRNVCDMLEWHIKHKRLQHSCGLPLTIQKSLNAFCPPGSKIINVRTQSKEKVTIIPTVNTLFFIDLETRELFENEVEKKIIQKCFGQPKLVSNSLKHFASPPPIPKSMKPDVTSGPHKRYESITHRKSQQKRHPGGMCKPVSGTCQKIPIKQEICEKKITQVKSVQYKSLAEDPCKTVDLSLACHKKKYERLLPDINNKQQIKATLELHLQQRIGKLKHCQINLPKSVARSIQLSTHLPPTQLLCFDPYTFVSKPNAISKNISEITAILDTHLRRKQLEKHFGVPPLVKKSINLIKVPPAPELRLYCKMDGHNNEIQRKTKHKASVKHQNITRCPLKYLKTPSIDRNLQYRKDVINNLEFQFKKITLSQLLGFRWSNRETIPVEVPFSYSDRLCTCYDYPYKEVNQPKHILPSGVDKEMPQFQYQDILNKPNEISIVQEYSVRADLLQHDKDLKAFGMSSTWLLQKWDSTLEQQCTSRSIIISNINMRHQYTKELLSRHFLHKIIMNSGIMPMCVIESYNILKYMKKERNRAVANKLRMEGKEWIQTGSSSLAHLQNKQETSKTDEVVRPKTFKSHKKERSISASPSDAKKSFYTRNRAGGERKRSFLEASRRVLWNMTSREKTSSKKRPVAYNSRLSTANTIPSSKCSLNSIGSPMRSSVYPSHAKEKPSIKSYDKKTANANIDRTWSKSGRSESKSQKPNGRSVTTNNAVTQKCGSPIPTQKKASTTAAPTHHQMKSSTRQKSWRTKIPDTFINMRQWVQGNARVLKENLQ